MIQRLLATALFVFAFVRLDAQPYGNEWINYGQKYYKIKIAKQGLFRIDSATLAGAGITGIDPRTFQLYNKGQQLPIFIAGESDGVFNSTDFIEFYAEKNDGTLDSLLYKNTTFIPNPYYSLINDTAVYFLTWDPGSLVNSRMLPATDTTYFTGGIPLSDYIFKEAVESYNSQYYFGETDPAGSTDSRYTRAEGWFGDVFTLGSSGFCFLPTNNIYAAGPPARFRSVVLGASKSSTLFSLGLDDHHLQISLNGGPVFKDTTFFGYASNRFITDIPLATLISGTNTFRFHSVADAGFTSNRTVISYVYVKYAHTLDLENKNDFTFLLPDNASFSQSHLDISNLNASGTVYLYDISNSRRVTVMPVGSTYRTLVPNGGEKKCYITSDANLNAVSSLEPVGPGGLFVDYAAAPVDSAYIIITHQSLMTEANNYKIYRSLTFNGGQHNVVLADIDQLYDQYAYGNVKSPLSIRGFCDRMLDLNSSAPPKNLFLIGKSLHMNDARNNAANYAGDLVPSFGYPSSDNLLTAGLGPALFAPAIPTGRLSARNNADVVMYLDKMIEYESNPPAEWMKQVLHFGGGNSDTEQAQLKAYLNGYKATIEGLNYGATVKDFFKTTSAPIEINSSDTLRDLINNGVSLMTFFGHASGTGFDQSIDEWSTYDPQGHYPFLLANSCYAGDIHSTGMSSSETYTFIPSNGVIGYVGSVGLGVAYALNYFSSRFYQHLSFMSYDQSVGTCIKNAITGMQPEALLDTLARGVCFEMTLHGDPALKINTHPKPDYKITGSDLYFDMLSDPASITVHAVRTNIGKATNDTIRDQLLQILPNGDTLTYLNQSIGPKFKDTISFVIPLDPVNGVGLNKVMVTLDHFAFVDELNEMNNSTGLVNMFVSGGNIIPVYPYEFAIIPKDTVTLKASTIDPFAAAKTYLFQIDTNDTFSSPLADTAITSVGGVVSWKPPLNFLDTVVYYWRVSVDSVDTSGYNWRESSFQYIPNKRGWEQAHFFQFKNNDYQFARFNRPMRRFDFVNDVKTITCINGVPEYIPYSQVVYKINGTVKYVSSWTLPGMTIAVFDPVSGAPWLNTTVGGGFGLYGSVTSYTGTDPAFDFRENTPGNRTTLTQFLQDTVPNGAYVLAYSQAYAPIGAFPSIPYWENTLYEAFDSLGSSEVRNVPDSMAYIFFGRKGAPMGTAKEIYGTSIADIIQLDTTIVTNWSDGYIASPPIGPASSWDSLSWRQHTLDGGVTADSIVIRVIGIRADGTESDLANFNTSVYNVPNLGSYVNVDTFPRIRLVAYMKDAVLTTPPQLDRWQVFYAPVPEAAIHPPAGYAVSSTDLQEGQDMNIRLPIRNISEIPFTQDSLLVTYWIEDKDRVNHYLPSKLKKKPFNPGEVIIDTITISTLGYPGANALWVEVNPVGQSRSQLEQYHFNNLARIPFNVSTDQINPLLDVTFDGIHILNNDVVSAKPNILIRLKDENQFLALNDTADFKVFVKVPSSITAQRIYFGDVMSFIPAVLPNNSCRINYTPLLTEDGIYQLIVQAKDKSDNQSGSIDYKINFEVVNRSTITEVMNYPNPFSTSTRFVFTLTGSQVPSVFKIQIMTITGKVVREIFQDELGPVHIGRNITDYAWDGKDEFGDQLANGVYLYRVITMINGGDIEKRQTEADQYFKKGWGKMYLMR